MLDAGGVGATDAIGSAVFEHPIAVITKSMPTGKSINFNVLPLYHKRAVAVCALQRRDLGLVTSSLTQHKAGWRNTMRPRLIVRGSGVPV